jgi:hypothetical protein
MQARVWIGVLIGSTIGGFIPDLWGAGVFSYSSVLLSGIGAFAGLWLARSIFVLNLLIRSDSPRLIQRVSWRKNQSLVELSTTAACSTNKH